jgi:5-methylcytosine-specific restriction protein A
MPTRPRGPCSFARCPRLAVSRGRCELHPLPARTHELSATRRGYDYRWRQVARSVLERDGYLCRYCGGPATTVDHLIPKARGGTDDDGNLVAACRPCNSAKGSR